jgi:hypothetical protein
MTNRTAPEWATAYTRRALEALPVDITTATPAQVDEMIRTTQLDARTFGQRVSEKIDQIYYGLGHEPIAERVGKGRDRRTVIRWTSPLTEMLTAAAEMPADTPAKGYRAYRYGSDKPVTIGELLAELDTLRAHIAEAEALAASGADEFDRRGGWTRYFRVNNSNGHVHTTRRCDTTYVTTAWSWPTNLSGADGDQVVEYAGALTCLRCFPGQREEILRERPVRFDMFETAEQRDERERRDQEKADKLAAKIAKGVTTDGSPLVLGRPDGYTVEVKTERAAELRYVEFAAAAQTGWQADRRPAYAEAAKIAIEALAAKRGTTVAAQIDRYADKVARKVADR